MDRGGSGRTAETPDVGGVQGLASAKSSAMKGSARATPPLERAVAATWRRGGAILFSFQHAGREGTRPPCPAA